MTVRQRLLAAFALCFAAAGCEFASIMNGSLPLLFAGALPAMAAIGVVRAMFRPFTSLEQASFVADVVAGGAVLLTAIYFASAMAVLTFTRSDQSSLGSGIALFGLFACSFVGALVAGLLHLLAYLQKQRRGD